MIMMMMLVIACVLSSVNKRILYCIVLLVALLKATVVGYILVFEPDLRKLSNDFL